MSDHELLQRYARERSDPAFATLVARHLALVYSAARRQVRSPQLAEDVTQSVFLALSRQAADLPADQSLVAWLHVVTRRTAIDLVRAEARRRTREHAASTLDHPPAAPSAWTEIEPLLDEAVESLPEPERTAILLRFFENKNYRDVGSALGTSDDAAQKRVTRALDQLRTFFLRRGITVTAAGLTADLSAHATLVAPAALAGAITTLGTTTLPTVIATAAETAVMTTLQKSLVTAAVILAAGTGLYEATTFYRQRDELTQLAARSAALTADLARTRAEQAAAARRLALVESQIDARLAAARAAPTPPATDPALEKQIRAWLANLDQLKQLITARPDLSIPELQLLSPDDWSNFAPSTTTATGLDTEAGLRSVSSALRHRAENLMAMKLQAALNAYVQSGNGELPSSLDQLLPHFVPAIAPELLTRYELLRTGKLSDLSANERFTGIIATRTPVDRERDMVWRIGTGGFVSQSARSPRQK